MKKTFLATIEGGKMTLDDSEAMRKFATKKEGRIFITIQHMTKPRSNNQNRYYWGVVVKLITEHTGQDPEDVHAFLGAKFLTKPMQVKIKGGITDFAYITESTTNLSTVQFESFMSKCRMWGSMFLALSIPEPNECEGEYSQYNYNPEDLENA